MVREYGKKMFVLMLLCYCCRGEKLSWLEQNIGMGRRISWGLYRLRGTLSCVSELCSPLNCSRFRAAWPIQDLGISLLVVSSVGL
jgi:hypothetical protein